MVSRDRDQEEERVRAEGMERGVGPWAAESEGWWPWRVEGDGNWVSASRHEGVAVLIRHVRSFLYTPDPNSTSRRKWLWLVSIESLLPHYLLLPTALREALPLRWLSAHFKIPEMDLNSCLVLMSSSQNHSKTTLGKLRFFWLFLAFSSWALRMFPLDMAPIPESLLLTLISLSPWLCTISFLLLLYRNHILVVIVQCECSVTSSLYSRVRNWSARTKVCSTLDHSQSRCLLHLDGPPEKQVPQHLRTRSRWY